MGRGDDLSLVGVAGAAGWWSWTISPDGVSWSCSNCVTIFTRTTEGDDGRMKDASGTAGDTGDSRVAVNARVRVYPETDGEVGGTVVEDFGDLAGHAVDIAEKHIVGPARRWAVALDAGGLVFVDSDQLVAE